MEHLNESRSFQSTLQYVQTTVLNNARYEELEKRLVEQTRKATRDRTEIEKKHYEQEQIREAQFSQEISRARKKESELKKHLKEKEKELHERSREVRRFHRKFTEAQGELEATRSYTQQLVSLHVPDSSNFGMEKSRSDGVDSSLSSAAAELVRLRNELATMQNDLSVKEAQLVSERAVRTSQFSEQHVQHLRVLELEEKLGKSEAELLHKSSALESQKELTAELRSQVSSVQDTILQLTEGTSQNRAAAQWLSIASWLRTKAKNAIPRAFSHWKMVVMHSQHQSHVAKANSLAQAKHSEITEQMNSLMQTTAQSQAAERTEWEGRVSALESELESCKLNFQSQLQDEKEASQRAHQLALVAESNRSKGEDESMKMRLQQMQLAMHDLEEENVQMRSKSEVVAHQLKEALSNLSDLESYSEDEETDKGILKLEQDKLQLEKDKLQLEKDKVQLEQDKLQLEQDRHGLKLIREHSFHRDYVDQATDTTSTNTKNTKPKKEKEQECPPSGCHESSQLEEESMEIRLEQMQLEMEDLEEENFQMRVKTEEIADQLKEANHLLEQAAMSSEEGDTSNRSVASVPNEHPPHLLYHRSLPQTESRVKPTTEPIHYEEVILNLGNELKEAHEEIGKLQQDLTYLKSQEEAAWTVTNEAHEKTKLMYEEFTKYQNLMTGVVVKLEDSEMIKNNEPERYNNVHHRFHHYQTKEPEVDKENIIDLNAQESIGIHCQLSPFNQSNASHDDDVWSVREEEGFPSPKTQAQMLDLAVTSPPVMKQMDRYRKFRILDSLLVISTLHNSKLVFVNYVFQAWKDVHLRSVISVLIKQISATSGRVIGLDDEQSSLDGGGATNNGVSSVSAASHIAKPHKHCFNFVGASLPPKRSGDIISTYGVSDPPALLKWRLSAANAPLKNDWFKLSHSSTSLEPINSFQHHTQHILQELENLISMSSAALSSPVANMRIFQEKTKKQLSSPGVKFSSNNHPVIQSPSRNPFPHSNQSPICGSRLNQSLQSSLRKHFQPQQTALSPMGSAYQLSSPIPNDDQIEKQETNQQNTKSMHFKSKVLITEIQLKYYVDTLLKMAELSNIYFSSSREDKIMKNKEVLQELSCESFENAMKLMRSYASKCNGTKFLKEIYKFVGNGAKLKKWILVRTDEIAKLGQRNKKKGMKQFTMASTPISISTLNATSPTRSTDDNEENKIENDTLINVNNLKLVICSLSTCNRLKLKEALELIVLQSRLNTRNTSNVQLRHVEGGKHQAVVEDEGGDGRENEFEENNEEEGRMEASVVVGENEVCEVRLQDILSAVTNAHRLFDIIQFKLDVILEEKNWRSHDLFANIRVPKAESSYWESVMDTLINVGIFDRFKHHSVRGQRRQEEEKKDSRPRFSVSAKPSVPWPSVPPVTPAHRSPTPKPPPPQPHTSSALVLPVHTTNQSSQHSKDKHSLDIPVESPKSHGDEICPVIEKQLPTSSCSKKSTEYHHTRLSTDVEANSPPSPSDTTKNPTPILPHEIEVLEQASERVRTALNVAEEAELCLQTIQQACSDVSNYDKQKNLKPYGGNGGDDEVDEDYYALEDIEDEDEEYDDEFEYEEKLFNVLANEENDLEEADMYLFEEDQVVDNNEDLNHTTSAFTETIKSQVEKIDEEVSTLQSTISYSSSSQPASFLKVSHHPHHALASLPKLIKSLRLEVCDACFTLMDSLFAVLDAEVKQKNKHSGCRARKSLTTKEAMGRFHKVLQEGIHGNVRFSVLVYLRSYESCRRMLHLRKLNRINAAVPLHSEHHPLYLHPEVSDIDEKDEGGSGEYDENYDYDDGSSKISISEDETFNHTKMKCTTQMDQQTPSTSKQKKVITIRQLTTTENQGENEETESDRHARFMSEKLNVLLTEDFCPLDDDKNLPKGKEIITKRFSALRSELRQYWLRKRRKTSYDDDGEAWSCNINVAKNFRTEFAAVAKEEFLYQKKLDKKNESKMKKTGNKTINSNKPVNKQYIHTKAGTHTGGSGLNPNTVSTLAASIFNEGTKSNTYGATASPSYLNDFYHIEADRIHASRCAHCFELDEKERVWRVELGFVAGGSTPHHFWKLVRKRVSHTMAAIERDMFQLVLLVKFANRKSGLYLRQHEHMRKLLDDKLFELLLVYIRRTFLMEKLIKESKDGTRIQFRTNAAEDMGQNFGRKSFISATCEKL